MLDPKDGGYRSRKLNYAMGTSAAIVALALLAAWKLPTLVPMLDTIVGGLMGTLAIYCGMNVTNKWTVGKTLKGTPVSNEENPG